ncbi:hypothetical protein IAQ61_002304, partial [Plenodomus lingam]|uniref:uncharacterized protein n=1 Tax=Leptosphaeria maculans TaxID=5022 RepID=UPI0033230BB6
MAVVLGGAEASPLSWDGYGWLACAPVPVPVFCFFPALGGLDDPRNALPHSIKGVDGQPSLPCNSIRSQWSLQSPQSPPGPPIQSQLAPLSLSPSFSPQPHCVGVSSSATLHHLTRLPHSYASTSTTQSTDGQD